MEVTKMKRTFSLALLIAAIGALTAASARAGDVHDHEHGDITVGHSGAGVLAVEYDFDEPTILESVNGLLNGWAGDEPGFAHLEADEPAEDFFTLADGANIVFEIVSIDDALIGNPLTDGLNAPGEQLVLGDYELHQHVDWLIDSDDPDFDPLQTVWTVEFKLLDTGTTNYGESSTYTWDLTNVPEPATGMLMLLGCAALRRRRRN
jgi:hypothetical protein